MSQNRYFSLLLLLSFFTTISAGERKEQEVIWDQGPHAQVDQSMRALQGFANGMSEILDAFGQEIKKEKAARQTLDLGGFKTVAGKTAQTLDDACITAREKSVGYEKFKNHLEQFQGTTDELYEKYLLESPNLRSYVAHPHFQRLLATVKIQNDELQQQIKSLNERQIVLLPSVSALYSTLVIANNKNNK